MQSTIRLLDGLLPPQSVKLGRLILNTKAPYQDFLDPISGRPTDDETIVNHHSNLEGTGGFTKSSKFGTYLNEILSISYHRQNDTGVSFSSPTVTTRHLINSGDWFEAACTGEKTREWLVKAHDNRRNVYLVVGTRTVENAKLGKSATSRTVKEGNAEVPVSAVASGIAAVTRSLAIGSPGTKTTRDVTHRQRSGFDAPGEKVCAIQYRKVRSKWFPIRKSENLYLEPGNRWKPCSDADDWRGVEDEDDDEEEFFEVALEDEGEEYFGIEDGGQVAETLESDGTMKRGRSVDNDANEDPKRLKM